MAKNSAIGGGLIGVLPQNPQSLFVKKTVREDLHEILRTAQLSSAEKERKITSMAGFCRLDGLLERHPYDLSGGEQQRAALAKVLLLEPQILLLDEPTKGLDAELKQVFAEIINALLKAGVTVIMVSHDVEFCAKHAHRCAMFFNGNIVSQSKPRCFFSGNSFYTTSASRMARHLALDAVTAEDIIAACGGAITPSPIASSGICFHDTKAATPKVPPPKKGLLPRFFSGSEIECEQVSADKRRLPNRTIAAMLMILLAIPLTIFVGIYYFGDRKYYFISLLVIIECMLPFFLIFENRRPQARELIIIAVLCAIGVAGRTAFFMLPQFKPVIAMVIISGVSFGGEAGFLVGAVTMLVSNIMLGQGPWTPWQMFAAGVIGFLAGVLFRKGLLRRSRLPLCIFGALSTLIIYGGLMNPSSVLMYYDSPAWPVFAAAYAAGLPMDLVHAAATFFFLWLASKPMLEKLDRIKVKYGLVE